MKLLGLIEKWITGKSTGDFGFVIVKHPVETGGFYVDRYFLHSSAIVFLMSEVRTGCLIRFNTVKTKKPNGFPLAVDAEIFDNQTAQSNQSAQSECTGLRTIAGSPNEPASN